MKRVFKVFKILFFLFLGIVAVLFVVIMVVLQKPEFGGNMDEQSLAKAESSPQYKEGSFENNPEAIPSNLMTSFKEQMGDQVRQPSSPFPQEVPEITDSISSSVKATWFGHATVYIELEGKRIMTDPMLSTHAYPFRPVAPKRYNPPPLQADQLPAIDFVTISHDHFDHLDMNTVIQLAQKGAKFFVGLGIKAHLTRWEVPDSQVYEMDWWESVTVDGFNIHCTPARHYSGRKWMDNSTLWTSWVIEGPNHKIYHSGDSGYGPHFEEIGKKFGPIDISFIKVGDYGMDTGWRDIHMQTEYSVKAAKDTRADLMFPIHWGTFSLSYHDWFEPINLAVEFAQQEDVPLVTPKLGQTISLGDDIYNEPWWKPLENEKPQ